MDRDLNFMPAVKCPYCGKLVHPAISGWGGELSTRVKCCRYCEKEYRLVVYSFADKEVGVTTGSIHFYQNKIEYLKQRIREKLNKVRNEYAEWAEEFLRVEQSTGGKQN